jgi:hypothetical protein
MGDKRNERVPLSAGSALGAMRPFGNLFHRPVTRCRLNGIHSGRAKVADVVRLAVAHFGSAIEQDMVLVVVDHKRNQ